MSSIFIRDRREDKCRRGALVKTELEMGVTQA
jgi:hypothetical protein